MSDTIESYLTEREFVEQAKAKGFRMTLRTSRKWRQRRLLPYAKIGQEVLIPRDWPAHLKVNKARQ
jgi:hypothetical protein